MENNASYQKKSLKNLYTFLKNLYFTLSNEYHLLLFNLKWQNINKHNHTFPANFFPIDKVTVGKGTYGCLNITSYNDGENEKLAIGNYVSIAPNVHFILGGNHRTNTFSTYPIKAMITSKNIRNEADSISKGPIIIEDEVWIGFNCTILSGVNIGKGAIIAAGAVVAIDVPAFAVVGGVPAHIIKYRFNEEVRNLMMDFSLNNFDEDFISKNTDEFYKTPDSNSMLFKRL